MKTPFRISLPYVGGVAIGALLCREGSIPQWYLCLFSSFAVALCFALCFLRRKSPALYILLLFLGMLCFSSGSLTGFISSAGHAPSGIMEHLRARIREQNWSVQTANLLQALLTGDKSSLPRRTKEAFRLSGAAHILALSGLHLGVLAGMMNSALKVIGNSLPARIARVVCVIATCTVYTLACGCSASLLRALLFITLSGIHSLTPGRRRSPESTFCAAQVIQLTINPLSILSVSFQLSYLSIAGILFIYPRMEKWTDDIAGVGKDDGSGISLLYRGVSKIWKSLALSLSCQITTAPLVYLKFGSLPLHFFLANLLGLPLAEALIILGAICLVLSSIGLCPSFACEGCDVLAGLLEQTLTTISLMRPDEGGIQVILNQVVF